MKDQLFPIAIDFSTPLGLPVDIVDIPRGIYERIQFMCDAEISLNSIGVYRDPSGAQLMVHIMVCLGSCGVLLLMSLQVERSYNSNY